MFTDVITNFAWLIGSFAFVAALIVDVAFFNGRIAFGRIARLFS